MTNEKASQLHAATAGARDVLDISVDLALSGLLTDEHKIGG